MDNFKPLQTMNQNKQFQFIFSLIFFIAIVGVLLLPLIWNKVTNTECKHVDFKINEEVYLEYFDVTAIVTNWDKSNCKVGITYKDSTGNIQSVWVDYKLIKNEGETNY